MMKVIHNGQMMLILKTLHMSQLKLIAVEEKLKLFAQTS